MTISFLARLAWNVFKIMTRVSIWPLHMQDPVCEPTCCGRTLFCTTPMCPCPRIVYCPQGYDPNLPCGSNDKDCCCFYSVVTWEGFCKGGSFVLWSRRSLPMQSCHSLPIVSQACSSAWHMSHICVACLEVEYQHPKLGIQLSCPCCQDVLWYGCWPQTLPIAHQVPDPQCLSQHIRYQIYRRPHVRSIKGLWCMQASKKGQWSYLGVHLKIATHRQLWKI